MPIAQINGQGVFYEDMGAGETAVIFRHGFLMAHTMFDPHAANLTHSYLINPPLLAFLAACRRSQNSIADDTDFGGLIRIFSFLSAKIRSDPRYPRSHFLFPTDC